MRFNIKIPATTANLGLGFDSMGLALEKFLTISSQIDSDWSFDFLNPSLSGLPQDETNLVAQTAMHVAKVYGKSMPTLRVEMDSEIPLTHGLGSSSSAIVAGVELANHFCQLDLSEYEKVKLATEIEGHPDNVGPCITGGVFVGSYDQTHLSYEAMDLDSPIGIVLSIPRYEVSTQEAREVLPKHFSRQDAVSQNALNNVAILALVKGDYKKAGELLMLDRFHEPYRKSLIKEFPPLKRFALEEGAYATVISGAGPTILTLCPLELRDDLVKKFEAFLPDCEHEIVEIYGRKICDEKIKEQV